MPALQVRDFPRDLYEELRSFAVAHHRSVAQQTVAAVDQMIHGVCEAGAPSSSAEVRMDKRERIFLRAAQRRECRAKTIPHPAEMLHAAREERDADLDCFVVNHLALSS